MQIDKLEEQLAEERLALIRDLQAVLALLAHATSQVAVREPRAAAEALRLVGKVLERRIRPRASILELLD